MTRRLAAITAAFSLWASPVLAQRTLVIVDFDARIVVDRDARLDITETITTRFNGQWNGMYRTIPVRYRTLQGLDWTIRLSDISATGEDGSALKVEKSREGHYIKLKIWVPGANDAQKTIALHYRAENGLRFFDDHDELYWNVTGDEWDVPIGAASAEIVLPDGVDGVRATAFNGVYGSRSQEAVATIKGNTVLVSMPHPLTFHEGVTAVVGWNTGVVTRPSAAARAATFLTDNWPLGIPLLVLAAMVLLWAKRGRDPGKRPVTVQYEPPADVSPAEAGILIDERLDSRDITATLVDLAVKGYLRIEEVEESKFFGLFTSTDYVLHRLTPEPGKALPLQYHENLMLDGLFDGEGSQVELSALENKFYRKLPGIQQAITRRLVEKGRYGADPATVRSRWRIVAIATFFLLMVLGGTFGARHAYSPLPFVAAAILSALVVLVIGHFMPARTVAGTRVLEQVLGFEEFLARVDKEHYARVVKTPEMFERFLPYAMAFGVERAWARAFKGILREPPRWYGGRNFGTFDSNVFTSRMTALTTTAGSSMSSSPRRSGGSGFSSSGGGGGGFSGGGGGGGGGGGF